MSKCPFFIVDNFLSPLECEDIISRSNFEFPNTQNGRPVKSITQNVLTQNRVLPYLEELIPTLEEYYGFEHGGILPFNIECYPANAVQEGYRCENSYRREGEWVRTTDVDLTCIIFLKEDNSVDNNFDDLFEVYGSSLQFINHSFGFRPERGQLIVFPSGPNFVNATISPKIGDMYQLRISLVGMQPYKYDMRKFPGNVKTWFNA